jgi:beta-hydroxylase
MNLIEIENLSNDNLLIYNKIKNDNNNKLLYYNYYDTLLLNNYLSPISENYDIIKNELYEYLINNNWLLWRDIVKLDKKEGWKTLPLYGFNKWTEISNFFPKLKKMTENIKEITLISFSKLDAGTILDPHRGWGETANHVLRNHLGIVVPNNCGLWVEGEIKYHIEKEWITFDDSKVHMAFNKSNDERIVLIIDTVRPKFIQIGTAPEYISDGLKDYIKNS